MPAMKNIKINYCVLIKVNIVDKFYLKTLLNVEKKNSTRTKYSLIERRLSAS